MMKKNLQYKRTKSYIIHILVLFIFFSCIVIHTSTIEVKAAGQAEKIVSVAKSQLGVKERSAGSDDVLYNDWYYGRRVNNNGVSAKYAWCAAFVSWCADQSGIPTNIIPKTANTTDMKNRLISLGGASHLKGSGYTPKCGDIIFFGSNASQHVGIVEYSSQSNVYYIDGNNTQTNPHGVHYSSCSLSYGSLWGFVSPNYSSNMPSNPQISKSQHWYDLQDRIEISAYADGATSYFMSMFKDGKKIISQGVEGGKFSMDAKAYGEGDYSAYFSCTNNAGTVDTKWIEFSVVGKATYSDVRASDYWYDLTDTVSITVDTVCAKGQYIGIDKEGVGRVITESSESTYKIEASKLGTGKYSAYFSVYNGSGGVDTKRVKFSIVGPATYSDVRVSSSWYDLKDTVSITVDSVCTKEQCIGIDKEGVGRVVTESTKPTYKIPASKLGTGKYSAYFSVHNGSGGVDTKRVAFEIVNIPKKGAVVSVSKKNYTLDDNVQISVSVQCSKYQTIGIDKVGAGRMVTEKVTNGKYQIPASKLGTGKYSAYFTVCNNSGGYDTSRVDFSIGDEDKTVDGEENYEKDKTDVDSSGNFGHESDTDEDDTDEENIDDMDEEDDDDTDTLLEVGDVVKAANNGDEYEITSMDGDVICVEYAESVNPRATTIKIPNTIKTRDGVTCKVTAISKCAFKNNRKLKKAVIGNNVIVIGTKAFFGCGNLTSVIIGKNVTTIEASAFNGCKKLTNITIPQKVVKIGANAFSGCKKLKKLDIRSKKLNAKDMNKKALKGISQKALIRVPKDKLKAYKKLFYQKGLSKRNKIKKR